MLLDEVCRLFKRDRRTIRRWVDAKKLPEPVDYEPMSFDRTAIKLARRRMREEAEDVRRKRKPNGRKHRKKRKRKARDGA